MSQARSKIVPSRTNRGTLNELTVLSSSFNKKEFLNSYFLVVEDLISKGAKVLLVDDGSTDGSVEIFTQFAKLHRGFNFFAEQKMGHASALNYVLERVETEFFIFLDMDDCIQSDNLIFALELSQRENYDLLICNYSTTTKTFAKQKNKINLRIIDNLETSLMENLGFWRIIYKTDFVFSNKIRWVPNDKDWGLKIFLGDDVLWVLHLASLKSNIGYLPEEFYLYLVNNTLPIGQNVNYLNSNSNFVQAVSIFVKKLCKCNHTHNNDLLNKYLVKYLIFHLSMSKSRDYFKNMIFILKRSTEFQVLKKSKYDLGSRLFLIRKSLIRNLKINISWRRESFYINDQ